MKELTTEKTMTVKEVATILNVTTEALKKHIRDLFPDKMQNGRTTYLTESEVVLIKSKMLPTTEVVACKTNLERKMIVMQAMQILQDEMEELKQQNALMLPKAEFYDKVTASDTSLTMNEVAKILDIGRNRLFSLLREENILMKNNLPYQKYAHHFEVREYPVLISGKTEVKTQTLVKQSGVDLIQRKLGGSK